MHDSGSIVFSVAFSPAGGTLAAASADGLTRLWSVADPARPVLLGQPLAGPASYVISVAFSPDGRVLAVGSHLPLRRAGEIQGLASQCRPIESGFRVEAEPFPHRRALVGVEPHAMASRDELIDPRPG